jgi:hypothetical protein
VIRMISPSMFWPWVLTTFSSLSSDLPTIYTFAPLTARAMMYELVP